MVTPRHSCKRQLGGIAVLTCRMVLGWHGRYLRGWFTVDLLATIPFEEVIPIDNVSVVSLLKVPRLLRVGRLMKKFNKFAAANGACRGTTALLAVLCCARRCARLTMLHLARYVPRCPCSPSLSHRELVDWFPSSRALVGVRLLLCGQSVVGGCDVGWRAVATRVRTRVGRGQVHHVR